MCDAAAMAPTQQGGQRPLLAVASSPAVLQLLARTRGRRPCSTPAGARRKRDVLATEGEEVGRCLRGGLRQASRVASGRLAGLPGVAGSNVGSDDNGTQAAETVAAQPAAQSESNGNQGSGAEAEGERRCATAGADGWSRSHGGQRRCAKAPGQETERTRSWTSLAGSPARKPATCGSHTQESPTPSADRPLSRVEQRKPERVRARWIREVETNQAKQGYFNLLLDQRQSLASRQPTDTVTSTQQDTNAFRCFKRDFGGSMGDFTMRDTLDSEWNVHRKINHLRSQQSRSRRDYDHYSMEHLYDNSVYYCDVYHKARMYHMAVAPWYAARPKCTNQVEVTFANWDECSAALLCETCHRALLRERRNHVFKRDGTVQAHPTAKVSAEKLWKQWGGPQS